MGSNPTIHTISDRLWPITPFSFFILIFVPRFREHFRTVLCFWNKRRRLSTLTTSPMGGALIMRQLEPTSCQTRPDYTGSHFACKTFYSPKLYSLPTSASTRSRFGVRYNLIYFILFFVAFSSSVLCLNVLGSLLSDFIRSTCSMSLQSRKK